MTTTGALGRRWRADVTAWGAVEPWDGSAPLDWAIAADDRWHRPADERAVRQQRVLGTPVVETRVSIPGGDAVQRIWSVADGGGLTLVEVTNESPMPIAVAFTRPDVLTNRPPTNTSIEGIDLPKGSVLVPIGHRTSVVVGLRHDDPTAGALPSGWPDPDAVVRGWHAFAGRAGRLVLPDERVGEAVVAARCELLLRGIDDPSDDPVGFLIGLGELVRLGELSPGQADDAAPDVAIAVESVARTEGWDVDAAVAAAARVLHHAGDGRAVRDVVAVSERRGRPASPSSIDERPDGVRAVPFVERELAIGGELFPAGMPAAWRGVSIEAHDLAAGPASTLSFALRWHGENPAALWNVSGDPVTVSAPAVKPGWRSDEASGETLWADPTLVGDPSLVAPTGINAGDDHLSTVIT